MDAKRWRGAMYLLGYAVECSLKAKLMERYDFDHLDQLQAHLSEKLGRRVDLFTHSLQILMDWTEAEGRMDRATRHCWGTTRKWRADWRYSPIQGNATECEQYFWAVDAVLGFVARSV